MMPRPSSRDAFQVAIICALPHEYDAVHYFLDEKWAGQDGGFGKATGDPNRYTTGRMGNLPVVVVLLPGTGKVDASSAARSLRMSYGNLAITLLVGVCGAVPHYLRYSKKTEIFLGDVIVSEWVSQYDFGWEYPDRFEPKKIPKDMLGRPTLEIRELMAKLRTRASGDELESKALENLQQLQAKVADTDKYRGIYDHLGMENDKLFKPEYLHKHQHPTACDVCQACLTAAHPVCEKALWEKCAGLGCSERELVIRDRPKQRQQAGINVAPAPVVHIGGFGSADRLMQSAKTRDMIAERDNLIAFDMEGAGVWGEGSCIVVKGVSDYADSHKSTEWQNYAAASAAATTKALLVILEGEGDFCRGQAKERTSGDET